MTISLNETDMHLSAKTHLAALAILELSLRHNQPTPVNLRTIAEAHGVSAQFLVQVLLQLKRAGLVRSVRGASGGYQLMPAPHKISLLDVVMAMEGPLSGVASGSNGHGNALTRVLEQAWNEVSECQQRHLSNISFDQLAQRAQAETANMYYI